MGHWDDEMIRYYRGSKYPLQGLQERLLMALSMRYVDDVVIGGPRGVLEGREDPGGFQWVGNAERSSSLNPIGEVPVWVLAGCRAGPKQLWPQT